MKADELVRITHGLEILYDHEKKPIRIITTMHDLAYAWRCALKKHPGLVAADFWREKKDGTATLEVRCA